MQKSIAVIASNARQNRGLFIVLASLSPVHLQFPAITILLWSVDSLIVLGF